MTTWISRLKINFRKQIEFLCGVNVKSKIRAEAARAETGAADSGMRRRREACWKFSVAGAENQGAGLCPLAAAPAGIRRCFFGHFQKAPKQTGTALLTGRKTCVSAYSVMGSQCTSQNG